MILSERRFDFLFDAHVVAVLDRFRLLRRRLDFLFSEAELSLDDSELDELESSLPPGLLSQVPWAPSSLVCV